MNKVVNVACERHDQYLYPVEAVAACVTTGSYSTVVAVVYRPGSAAISPIFFDELSMIFEAVATYSMSVHVVGDFNVRLDRPEDPNTRQLLELVGSFGFHVRPTASTHQLGGTIDAVFTRLDLPSPFVRTVDVGRCLTTICWNGQSTSVVQSLSPLRFLCVRGVSSILRIYDLHFKHRQSANRTPGPSTST
jgi:hypothetical protein